MNNPDNMDKNSNQKPISTNRPNSEEITNRSNTDCDTNNNATEFYEKTQYSWQNIQKYTFTCWCNAVLASKNIQLNNLYDDLHDGTILIELYQILSGKKVPKYNKSPKILQQIIENLHIVIKLFQQDGLAMVNIGPMDIYDKNEKLILGLIWHLILYYQIGGVLGIGGVIGNENIRQIDKLPPSRDIDPTNNDRKENPPKHIIGKTAVSSDQSRDPSIRNDIMPQKLQRLSLDSTNQIVSYKSIKPQKLILDWIRSLLEEFQIKNLTTDWNDGILLGALTNRLNPECCVNYKKWKRTTSIQNITDALEAAKYHLNIPNIIKPEHLASGEIDSQSFMTYISQFIKKDGVAFQYTYNRLKRLAPQIATLASSMEQNCWSDGVALASLTLCCNKDLLKYGYYQKICFNNDIDSSLIQIRSLFNIKSSLVDIEENLHIEPTFSPDELYNQKAHPIAFITYINHILNILEHKDIEVACATPTLNLDTRVNSHCHSKGVYSYSTEIQHKDRYFPCAINDDFGKPKLEMFWVTKTELCYPGDELIFQINNFTQSNAIFDDLHIEITYDEDVYNSTDKLSDISLILPSKKFVPFKLIQDSIDTIRGKFVANKHGVYRVQAFIKGQTFQKPILKKTSSSESPMSPTFSLSPKAPNFECVVHDDYIIVDTDLALTVYSSQLIQTEQFQFVFKLSDDNNITADCKLDHSDSLRYVFYTKFNIPGEYTLYIHDNKNTINYHFEECTVYVGDPSKLTIVSSSNRFVNPSEKIQIVCDITNVGPGYLNAEIIYENKFFGFATVSTKQEGLRLYAIICYAVPFIINGTFGFKLKWNDYNININPSANKNDISKCWTCTNGNNFSTTLEFISFDPSEVVIQGDGLDRTVTINTDQYFTITVNNIKCIKKIDGYIKMMEDISNKKTKIKLQPDNHNTYVGCYQLQRVGTYELDLLINGQNIFRKPYIIESIDPSFIKVEIESEPRIINQQFIIKILVYKKAGKGDLFYSLEGPNGPLKMSIEPQNIDDEKECFLLCSTTNCVGDYCMQLTYGGHPINGFPKIFSVFDLEINQNTVDIDIEKLSNLIENTIHDFTFRINGLDSRRDCKLLSGMVVDLDDYENIVKETPVIIKSADKNGIFLGSFPVTSKNTKFLNLYFNNVPFPGNPYPLDVFLHNSFTLEIATNIISNQAYINDPITIILRAPIKFYEKELNCSLKILSQNETITLEKGQNTTTLSPYCEIQYIWIPTTVTTYNICAYFNNNKLTNTSTTIEIYQKPAKKLIKDHNILLKSDDLPKILPIDDGIITPRIMMNEHGNVLYLSGYMLNKNCNTKTPLKFHLAQFENGTKIVNATYYRTPPGIYSVWINYDDEPVEDSPFRVEVVDIKSFKISPDFDQYKFEIPSGECCYFNVTLPIDILSQNCSVIIKNPMGQTFEIPLNDSSQSPNAELIQTDDFTQTFKIKFLEPTDGNHTVGIVYKTIPIDESFNVVCMHIEKIDINHIRAIINNPENVLFNTMHEFQIQTDGIDKDHLRFQGFIHIHKLQETYLKSANFIRKNKNLYVCQFHVNSTNSKYIRILCENEEINGSPFGLNIIDLTRAAVVFPMLENSGIIQCGDNCKFKIYIPYNSGDGKLNIECTIPNDEIVGINYEKDKKKNIDEYKNYTAKFRPTNIGKYTLNITYGGFHLPKSPLIFEVKPKISDPQNDQFSLEFNSDKTYYVGESNLIPVFFGKRMTPDKLKSIDVILVDDIRRESRLKLQKDVEYSGYYDKYYMDLNLKREGTHQIRFINKTNSNIHSFEIESKRKYASGLYATRVPEICHLGENFSFDVINSNDVPTKTIRCRCIGPNNEASNISITINSVNSYTVHVTPKCVGQHRIELEADGLPIKHSPYLLMVLKTDFEDSIRVSGPGLESGVLGEYIGEFDINIIGCLEGALEIQVTGPDRYYQLISEILKRDPLASNSNQQLNGIESCTIRCRFDPTAVGIYIINIEWKGKPIKNSPFKVYLCDKKNQLDRLRYISL